MCKLPIYPSPFSKEVSRLSIIWIDVTVEILFLIFFYIFFRRKRSKLFFCCNSLKMFMYSYYALCGWCFFRGSSLEEQSSVTD